MQQSLSRAVASVAKYGDTDVLPFPTENHVFFDMPKESCQLLEDLNSKFDDSLRATSAFAIRTLGCAGYEGYRWITQIEPVWNAYLLGLTISLAETIETHRLPTTAGRVYSYRFAWNSETSGMFDTEMGWSAFQKRAIELASKYQHVVSCDISDFYPRIYHHRLENALRTLVPGNDAISRINLLLSKLAGGISYGLPVGGNAARMLSEALLNRIDHLLHDEGIEFCRFVDDYRIFGNSRDEVHRHLFRLVQSLGDNEGLSIQRAKTVISTSREYIESAELRLIAGAFFPAETTTASLLNLRIQFDPYSATAEADYDRLKNDLSKFDIMGMLGREIAKSRPHIPVSRKLIAAIRFLSPQDQVDAVRTIFSNMAVLYPVFGNIAVLLKSLHSTNREAFNAGAAALCTLLQSSDHYMRIPTHLAYSVRILALSDDEQAARLLIRMFQDVSLPMIRRDIIIAMAHKRKNEWLSDKRVRYGEMSPWEQRAIFAASHVLGDEGKHWRQNIAKNADPMALLMDKWARSKIHENPDWRIPV